MMDAESPGNDKQTPTRTGGQVTAAPRLERDVLNPMTTSAQALAARSPSGTVKIG